MIRYILPFMGLLSGASLNAAELSWGRFQWQKSGRFQLELREGYQSRVFRGVLKIGESAEAQAAEWRALLRSHGQGFLSVILVSAQEKNAQLFLIEPGAKGYHAMNRRAIRGPADDLGRFLNQSLKVLEENNGWDVSLTFRAMAEYFESQPRATMVSFLHDAQWGKIRTVYHDNQMERFSEYRERPRYPNQYPNQSPYPEYGDPHGQGMPYWGPQGPQRSPRDWQDEDENPYGYASPYPPYGQPYGPYGPPMDPRQRQQRRGPQPPPMDGPPWGYGPPPMPFW